MQRVEDSLGGTVRLPRTIAVEMLDSAVSQHRLNVLIGNSGIGKSVVARRWAEHELDQDRKVLWLEAQTFERLSVEEFETSLNLGIDIRELCKGVVDDRVTLVLDGLDRVYDSGIFAKVATLFNFLNLNLKTSPWRIVIPCQTPEWPRIDSELRRSGFHSINLVECTPLDLENLQPVWNAFPAIARLPYQPTLKSILTNLQLLQIITLGVGSSDTDVQTWVSESDVIEWFWKTYFTDASSSKFAKRLSEYQADQLRGEVGESDFEEAQLLSVPRLIQNRICQRHDERIGFEHDLYGDWARQRILLERRELVGSYLESRLSSPLWHRAVRLYGQYLLERNPDAQAWKTTLDLLSTGTDAIAQDLMLEATALAINPAPLLESVASFLFAENGRLLKRLLVRFLISATVPNAAMVALAKQENFSEHEASALFRQPYPYAIQWIALIRFLRQHQEKVLEFVPEEAATLIEIWLETTSPHSHGRVEASEMALRLGQQTWEQRGQYTHRKSRELMYKVALLAGDELPDETAQFVLIASERIKKETDDQATMGLGDLAESDDDPAPRKTLSYREIHYPGKSDPIPWPDGPNARIDDNFRKVVLEKNALKPLMRTRPDVAKEVLLAVLIKPPERRWPQSWSEEREFQLESVYGWQPALYTHGGFFNFLQFNFEEGLDFILRLVQFAAERWEEESMEKTQNTFQDETFEASQSHERHPRPVRLVLNLESGLREFIGEKGLFAWYRGLGGSPPISVVSALMALEKNLYDRINSKEDISNLAQRILERAQNTAILGVLCAVARHHPVLLEGALSPLLQKLEIFNWDMQATTIEEPAGSHFMNDAYGKGKFFFELSRAFHGMEHRKKNLEKVVFERMLTSLEIRPYLENSCQEWAKLLEHSQENEFSPQYVKRMIAGFNLANWQMEQTEQGIALYNQTLADLQAENARDPINQMFDESTFLMGLTMDCYQFLESKKTLPEDQLESFWISMEKAQLLRELSETNWGMHTPEASILGGIAVLICQHQDWLEKHPIRADWCSRTLLELVTEMWDVLMPVPLSLEFGTGFEGPAFAAHALPILWAKNPEDHELRKSVLTLVMHGGKDVLKILMRGCGQHREILGKHFQQLWRFVLEVAGARQRNHIVRGIMQYPDPNDALKTQFDTAIQEWQHLWVNDFIAGTSAANQVPWHQISIQEFFKDIDPHLFKYPWSENLPLLDIEFLQYTHIWLEHLETAKDPEERQSWIEFWIQALKAILPRAKPKQRKKQQGFEEDSIGYPDGAEHWILNCIATLLAQLHESENPRQFWEPILTLSPGRRWLSHSWISCFFQSWHSSALRRDPIPSQYVETTRTMFEYACTDARGNGPWLNFDEPWLELVGVGSYTRSDWGPRHKDIVRTLHDVFLEWAEFLGVHSSRVEAFALFLERDAAESIRLNSLDVLSALIAKHKTVLDDPGSQIAISSFLRIVWDKHQTLLRANPERFRGFQASLRALVDRNHPSALELTRRIANV
jgi:hypothetical protein